MITCDDANVGLGKADTDKFDELGVAKFTHVEDLLAKFCADSDLSRSNLLDENGHTPPCAYSRRPAAHHQRELAVTISLHALGVTANYV